MRHLETRSLPPRQPGRDDRLIQIRAIGQDHPADRPAVAIVVDPLDENLFPESGVRCELLCLRAEWLASFRAVDAEETKPDFLLAVKHLDCIAVRDSYHATEDPLGCCWLSLRGLGRLDAPGPGYRSRYAEFLKIDFPRLPLAETIRIMAEIDEVIDQHGGWPDTFVTGKDGDS